MLFIFLRVFGLFVFLEISVYNRDLLVFSY